MFTSPSYVERVTFSDEYLRESRVRGLRRGLLRLVSLLNRRGGFG
jgi:hypothetical protein